MRAEPLERPGLGWDADRSTRGHGAEHHAGAVRAVTDQQRQVAPASSLILRASSPLNPSILERRRRERLKGQPVQLAVRSEPLKCPGHVQM